MLMREMSPEQRRAQAVLDEALWQARSSGETVACVDTHTPKAWDKQADESWCEGCPVREACLRYAATGAVIDGVMAGMKMHNGGVEQAARIVAEMDAESEVVMLRPEPPAFTPIGLIRGRRAA